MRAKIVIALLALLLVAVPASASRHPRKKESAGIYAALVAKNLTCAQYPAGSCKIRFRISTVNPKWASARVRPDTNGENIVHPVDVGLRRPHRSGGGWMVKSTGNGGGCNVPKGARHDLGLICIQF
jgi:hypothetical protein